VKVDYLGHHWAGFLMMILFLDITQRTTSTSGPYKAKEYGSRESLEAAIFIGDSSSSPHKVKFRDLQTVDGGKQMTVCHYWE
jgi:hypothetical protein